MRPEIRVHEQAPTDVEAIGSAVASTSEHPDAAYLAALGFSGKAGETATLPGAPMRVVVGDGDTRRMAAAFARAVKRHRTVAFEVPDACPLGVFAEAFLLASYRFTKYKSSPAEEPALERLDLVSSQDAGLVERARVIARAVALARDLVNEPGGVLTPAAFAEQAVSVAAASGLECDVWDEKRIAAERLGGLLGVARGSTQPPRLVRLAYRPASPEATIALVGKGITFDSGGLSMKTTPFMVDMKYDMAGAAAVLGAMSALRDLGCTTAATAWIPLTDNMSGGDATRLGDVLRTRNGITIEVRNADAEGRLILADGLALAAEEAPDSIVDIATLTDAVPMVIGRRYGGLAGNDEAFVQRVRAAAERAGERLWPMPLDGIDRKMLDSKIGDIVNAAGSRYGQSASAALFLKEFVPDGIPWAHLDIAGPAFADEDDGEWTAGGTGFGVRTLIELLRTPGAD